LKGSLQGRETEITQWNMNDPYLARKDVNFMNEEKILKIIDKNKFLENITKDAEFFEDFNLMDYSLLLIKLDFKEESISEFIKFKESRDYEFYSRHIYHSKQDSNIFYVCFIIDFFQEYNLRKKMENNFKNLIIERQGKSDLISCVPSDVYSSRFIEYLTMNSE
jgi:1-phosphatidylinositol-4-phosphate 5-kinase